MNFNNHFFVAVLAGTTLLMGCAKADSQSDKNSASYVQVKCNADGTCQQDFVKRVPIKVNGLYPRVPQYRTTKWVSIRYSINDHKFQGMVDGIFSHAGWERVKTNILPVTAKSDLLCTVEISQEHEATLCWSKYITGVTQTGTAYYGPSFSERITAFEHMHDALAPEPAEEE